ncbi:MAG: hypothetical protein ACRC2H_00975 [Silanimonas sp.]
MSYELRQLRGNFELYAPAALKIREKNGAVRPFRLNAAQREIHRRIEEQLSATGKVRALILKGRQQGCSTYVEGRFYWRVSGEFGKTAFILTHKQDATDNLFGMASRYHEHCPPELQPSTKRANAKELYFDKLDSGYKVATAGGPGSGRSSTAQYFHGSEVAFWPNAEDHMAGMGQIIPNAPGTEIILESTANGLGNLFHKFWQLAERGASEYIAIFIPWFIQEEYRLRAPEDYVLDDDEVEYAEINGCDRDQMWWRKRKIEDDFQGDENYFKQEYPANAVEAFVNVGSDPFIKPALVLKARAPGIPLKRSGPLIVGVDPARFGDDSTGIIRRHGRVAYGLERINKADGMAVAGRVVRILIDEEPDVVFIDIGGLGGPIYDRLVELKWGHKVRPVNFGEKAYAEERYVDRRSEMWGGMRDWLKTVGGVQIERDDSLMGDLVGPQYDYDSAGRTRLESKQKMRKRGLSSPDAGDALALTFAEPVGTRERRNDADDTVSWRDRLKKIGKRRGGGAMSA